MLLCPNATQAITLYRAVRISCTANANFGNVWGGWGGGATTAAPDRASACKAMACDLDICHDQGRLGMWTIWCRPCSCATTSHTASTYANPHPCSTSTIWPRSGSACPPCPTTPSSWTTTATPSPPSLLEASPSACLLMIPCRHALPSCPRYSIPLCADAVILRIPVLQL